LGFLAVPITGRTPISARDFLGSPAPLEYLPFHGLPGRNSYMRKLVQVLVLGLFAPSLAHAQQAVQWRYVDQLAGHYGVGNFTIWNTSLEGCTKEAIIQFDWQRPEGPRYLIYELTGTVVEPSFTWTGTPEDWQHPEEFNFNGGILSGGSGLGWGTSLNVNRTGTFGPTYPQLSTYEPSTGRFYFGTILDRAQGSSTWQSTIYVYARFWLYENYGPDTYDFLKSGSIHVESMRVGMADLPYQLGSLPLEVLSPTSFCDGDVSQDCQVDGEDLGCLLSVWGSSFAAADLNGDGIVDGADLAVVLAGWGPCPN
jgi:hypothetical protein